jgi:peptide/nickel transport system permease protein
MSTETGRDFVWTRSHRWLLQGKVTSGWHARLQSIYLGWLNFSANPLALVGLLIVLFLLFVAAFAPLLATHDPIAQDLNRTLLPPGGEYWFGTDQVGRDVYSRVVYGSRITLYIVFLVTVIVTPIGLAIGTAAGYLGGWVDVVLMRITDIFLSFPSLILALAFVAALGPSLENAILAMTLTAWPPIARLARAETMTIRKSDYIAAVELQGASPVRVILRHIVPMCMSSVIVRATLNMAAIILTAAGLGFLGLGAQQPSPEWGAMTSSGRTYLLNAWWLVTMPGLAIATVGLAFNLLGDGLRDVLDPRT